jgi:hypothetical protein
MSQRILLKKGTHANLPTSGMLTGEPLVTLDRGNLHVATGAASRIPIAPAMADLDAMGAVDGTTDLLIIHDANAANQREKKITINAFKAALSIPESSTDEKVAVVSGGTAGYLWGSDGTDGVFRMGNSLSWAKDAGNAFVTLNVATVDGGEF